MASLDTFRTVTVRGQSQGLDKLESNLKAVAGAQREVAATGQAMAVVSDTSSSRTLSVASALEKLARGADRTYRLQQDLAKQERLLQIARDQGLTGMQAYSVMQTALAARQSELAASNDNLARSQLAVARATVTARAAEEEAARSRASSSQRAIDGRLGVRAAPTDTADRAAGFEAALAAADRLRAKYDVLFAAEQRYRGAVDEIDAAERAGILTATAASDARLREASAYADLTQKAERAAVAQKAAAQQQVARVTVVPDRGADIAAYGAEMDRLRAKYNPLFAAGQQYKATLAEIRQAHRVGAISEREFGDAISHSKDQFAKQVKELQHETSGGFSKNQKQEFMHIGRALGDEFMATGSLEQGLKVEAFRIAEAFGEGKGGVAGTFKAFAGLLGRVATGWVGFSVATAAGIGLIAAAALSYEASQERMQRSLEGTGRIAGVTAAQLRDVADAASKSAHLTIGEGRSLAGTFTQAGVGPGLTGSLIAETPRFARFTDQDNGEAGAKLAEAFKDPVAGAAQLDRSLGFLNDRLSTTIAGYEASGQHERAQIALHEAFEAALKHTTDSAWAASEAMRELKRWGGSLWDLAGRKLTGADKPLEEQLAAYKAQLPHTFDSPLAVGNLSRSYVQSRIDALQHEIDARHDPEADKRDAESNDLSKLVGPLVRGILPELGRADTAEHQLTLLRQALASPDVLGKLGMGIGPSQVTAALQRTAVTTAFADPGRRMSEDYRLAMASADAFTLAERAAVDARRAELAVMRETGDVARASIAAEMARNEAIAKANQDAKDSLEVSRQNAGLIGLSPAERSQQEIRNRFEGYGGLIAKASASRSELEEAMRPVADDLHAAGETIAKAMRDVAATITATTVVPATTAPQGVFGSLRTATFGGAAMDGAPANIRAMVLAASARTGEDPNIVAAIGKIENSYRLTGGTSMLGANGRPSTAWGFGQLTNGAARDVASAVPGFNKYDPNTAVFGTAEYLHILRERFGGNLGMALNAYGGTPDYASKVMRASGSALAGAPTSADVELKPIEVHGSRSAGVTSGPAPVAPIAATAAGTYRTQMNEELSSDVKAHIVGPLQEANTALNARIALLGTETSSLGQNAAAQQAAAEARKLLSQYEGQDPNHSWGAEAWHRISDGVDLYRQKLQGAIQAEQDFQAHQRDIIGAMDDVRESARGAMSSFVGDVLHGKSALEGLHDALSSIETKLAGKVEDSAIDMLFGKSGGAGGGIFGSGLSKLFSAGSTPAPAAASSFFPAFAGGGWVDGPGTSTSDSIPARLSKGEFVVHAAAAAQHPDLLHAINAGRLPGFADGGWIGSAPVGGSGAGWGGGDAGGDVHLHSHVHVDGASGDAHVVDLATRAAQGVLQHPTSVAFMQGALKENARRGTRG